MSETQSEPQGQGQQATEAEASWIDQAIAATPRAQPDEARRLVETFLVEAQRKTVTFDRNLTRSINRAVAELDAQISRQLNGIVHHPRFQKLEGSWRGLHYLVKNSDTGTNLKIRVLNVGKDELNRDFTRAVEFDQSTLFRAIYENEFGQAGGSPYGALIGDYEWTHHPEDVETLRGIAQVSAAAFAPFISAAGPELCGFKSWTELPKTRQLETIFEGNKHTAWRSFRDSDESRFVTMVMPRVLARLPYGKETKKAEGFNYEEAPIGQDGTPRAMAHDHYCWMNAAYAMGARLTHAFAEYGFCTAIRGKDSGGRVDNLPLHAYISEEGDDEGKCPAEVLIPDRREKELSDLGLLPLIHYKNTDYAVFISGQTTHKPQRWDTPDATANEQISARLPYLMATSRFAHYLKIMARDKIGSAMEAEDCERWLNRWIMRYTNGNPDGGEEMRAKFPLREARIQVVPVPGSPGEYRAVAHLRPWLQFEALTASLRLVADVPKRA